MMSPGLTSAEALAILPLSVTLPLSQASLATVRLLISLEILRYLSSLILCASKIEKPGAYTPGCCNRLIP